MKGSVEGEEGTPAGVLGLAQIPSEEGNRQP